MSEQRIARLVWEDGEPAEYTNPRDLGTFNVPERHFGHRLIVVYEGGEMRSIPPPREWPIFTEEQRP